MLGVFRFRLLGFGLRAAVPQNEEPLGTPGDFLVIIIPGLGVPYTRDCIGSLLPRSYSRAGCESV